MRTAVVADAPRSRDVFLCHAWDDRNGAALELYDSLTSLGVDAWFSEKDLVLGKSLARQLDRGLSVSQVGVVLVTSNMMNALSRGGFADQELGALLATDRVIPISHGISYELLKQESPLLAARTGLDTAGSSLSEIACKIAQTVLNVDLDHPPASA